jgi:hypothetical protein
MTNTSKQILWKRKKQSNLHTRLLILARTKQLHNVMLGVAHDVDFLVLLQFQSRQCLFQFSFTASANGQHKNELNTHTRDDNNKKKQNSLMCGQAQLSRETQPSYLFLRYFLVEFDHCVM